jgi:hypothetical protein
MGMDTVGTLRWDGAVAQARMDNLLSAHYTDDQVHGVLSPYDGLSIGILSSLKGVGYGSGDLQMPIVSGQDAEVPSVKSILAGEQYSTVFKDTRELARVTVGMVEALLEGGEPEINDTETYDNGVIGRALLSAGAGHRRRVQLGRDPDRLGLLHRWTRSSNPSVTGARCVWCAPEQPGPPMTDASRNARDLPRRFQACARLTGCRSLSKRARYTRWSARTVPASRR